MGTTSGECVSLGRQYTFRTTRETEWLDDILMGIPTKDRARFIRKLIINGLEVHSGVIQKDDKPKTNTLPIKDKPTTIAPPPPTEPIEDIEEEDLESKLDNLGF